MYNLIKRIILRASEVRKIQGKEYYTLSVDLMMAYLKEIRQRILVKRSRLINKGKKGFDLVINQREYLKEFSFINPQKIIIALSTGNEE